VVEVSRARLLLLDLALRPGEPRADRGLATRARKALGGDRILRVD
jgi:hypothetical protein